MEAQRVVIVSNRLPVYATFADGGVTLVTMRNEKITLSRDEVDSLQESPVSLMPENLLKDLKPQELRDLFRYIQQDS